MLHFLIKTPTRSLAKSRTEGGRGDKVMCLNNLQFSRGERGIINEN